MAPFRIVKPRFLKYFAVEGGLIFAVLYSLASLTVFLRPLHDDPYLPASILTAGAVFSTLLLLVQGSSLGDQSSLRRELALFSTISFIVGIFGFAAIWILLGKPVTASSLLPLEGAIAVPIAISGWRWMSVRFDVFNATRENVLIVGTGEMARQVCRWIGAGHSSEYAVIGFADEDDSRLGTVLAMGARIQTDYAALASFARERADRVIVSLDEKRGKLPVRQLMELRLLGLEIEEATSFFERISGKISVETMLPSWLIFSEGFKSSALRSVLKRTVDLLHASVLLLIAGPLMLLTALAILITSGRPVIYRQARMGHRGREFDVLKFRSMTQDAERESGPTWAQQNDPRVTAVGRMIRATRIDELPQLINIFRGEMSFVGPRPERRHFVRQLEEKIPYYGLRTTVRPGLTGWAQVEYRYGATVEDALEKLKYDLYYIKNNTVLLDLWIVLKTVHVVLLRRGAR